MLAFFLQFEGGRVGCLATLRDGVPVHGVTVVGDSTCNGGSAGKLFESNAQPSMCNDTAFSRCNGGCMANAFASSEHQFLSTRRFQLQWRLEGYRLVTNWAVMLCGLPGMCRVWSVRQLRVDPGFDLFFCMNRSLCGRCSVARS